MRKYRRVEWSDPLQRKELLLNDDRGTLQILAALGFSGEINVTVENGGKIEFSGYAEVEESSCGCVTILPNGDQHGDLEFYITVIPCSSTVHVTRLWQGRILVNYE